MKVSLRAYYLGGIVFWLSGFLMHDMVLGWFQ